MGFCNLKVDLILHMEHFKNKILENNFTFYFYMVCSMLLYDDSINLPEFLKLHMRLEVCGKKYTQRKILVRAI